MRRYNCTLKMGSVCEPERSEVQSCDMQGLHDAGYEVILVGHSLGAGAAALLGLRFKAT